MLLMDPTRNDFNFTLQNTHLVMASLDSTQEKGNILVQATKATFALDCFIVEDLMNWTTQFWGKEFLLVLVINFIGNNIKERLSKNIEFIIGHNVCIHSVPLKDQ